MNDCNSVDLKRLQELKKQAKDHDIKLKLNLFIRVIQLQNVHEACRRMGMGRTFYYKWWKRFKKSGLKLSSLQEKSRRPKKSPKKTSKSIESKIMDLKALRYGALMIHGMLKRENIKLSVSTISYILNERKPVPKKERKKLNPHNKRYELLIPGERLQVDVKYVPYKVNNEKAYTYVAIDECTRWRFAFTFNHLDHGNTYLFLEMLKEKCPFPIVCIQTDNGFEFTNKLNPLTRHIEHTMDQWCRLNNIIHRLIPPELRSLMEKLKGRIELMSSIFIGEQQISVFEHLTTN